MTVDKITAFLFALSAVVVGLTALVGRVLQLVRRIQATVNGNHSQLVAQLAEQNKVNAQLSGRVGLSTGALAVAQGEPVPQTISLVPPEPVVPPPMFPPVK